MNYLEEVPFKTPLGPLEKPLGEVELVTAPQITIPDYLQILRDTEYEFTLENWVLTGLQDGYPRDAQRALHPPRCGRVPTCPPYWLMFSSPQKSHLARSKSSDPWDLIPRPRSHSWSAADIRCRNRARLLISKLEDEAGYSEDDEGSSTDDNGPRPSRSERPRTDEGSSTDDNGPRPSRSERPRTAPKYPLSRLENLHLAGSSADHSYTGIPRDPPHHRRSPLSTTDPPHHRRSPLSPRQPFRSMVEQSRPSSPLCHSERQSRMRQRSQYSVGRNESQSSQLPFPGPSRFRKQRPSSAGPIVKNNRHRALRFRSSRDLVLDSSAELLSALSQEERELLEDITEQGYPLRMAILALEKTGYRSPEKIMSYLVASDWLCELGYDEAQVEEALEMYQNCERKAAEFLHLLAQFSEMGFQQSAIKEVLLLHENHREKALEELMMRVA